MIFFGSLLFLILKDKYSAASFLLGGLAMQINMALLALSWALIIKKKLIALGLPTIVIKYAILGIIVYWSMTLPWLQVLAYVGGLATILPSVLLMGFIYKS